LTPTRIQERQIEVVNDDEAGFVFWGAETVESGTLGDAAFQEFAESIYFGFR